jgi:hypothetical protein
VNRGYKEIQGDDKRNQVVGISTKGGCLHDSWKILKFNWGCITTLWAVASPV